MILLSEVERGDTRAVPPLASWRPFRACPLGSEAGTAAYVGSLSRDPAAAAASFSCAARGHPGRASAQCYAQVELGHHSKPCAQCFHVSCSPPPDNL